MKNRQLTAAAGLCALLGLSSAAAAQDASELSLESLLNQEVSSASRFAQRIADAPSAITVITAEDIRRMGAVHLADALRMVPGLNVRTKTSGSYAVNARNAADAASPRMLVLLDGRVTSIEVHSTPVWEAMIVSIEQIERIEVVRGPGSALYGANAYDGVISITTRRPGGGRDIVISGNAGEAGERRASAVYRQSLGAFRVDGFLQARSSDLQGSGLPGTGGAAIRRAGESTMGSVRLGWSTSSGADLEVAAGLGSTRSVHYWSYGAGRRYDLIDTRYLSSTYQHPAVVAGADLRVRAAHTGREVAGAATSRTDGEVSLDRILGSHRLITGAAATHLRGDESEYIGEPVDQLLYGIFAQDVWSLSRAFELTAGLRYDHHPLAGAALSPRATLLVRPSQLHTFRFSGGRAFRNPTPLENHFYLTAPTSIPGVEFRMIGNPELEPEAVESYEIGYIGSPHPRVTLTADVFTNHQHEEVVAAVADSIALGGGVVMPTVVQWTNLEGGTSIGGEASVVVAAASWLRLAGSYSHLRMQDHDGVRMNWAPAHTVNAEAGVRLLPQLWLNATYHRVGDTGFRSAIAIPGAAAMIVPGHDLVHLNADASLPRGLRASVFVQNLTDRRYESVPGGERLGRRMVGSLSVRF